MKVSRFIPPLALTLACFSLAQLDAPALRAEDKPEVKLDQPASSTTGLRVAVLPVVNASGDVDATKILEDVLTQQFKLVDRSKAIFLMPDDVERILSEGDGLARASRLTDRWSKNGALDSTAISGLDTVLVADAVLCVKISEWDTQRFHNIGQGQSHTTVGLHFALFGIKDRRKLWTKDVREQRLAREYDISSGTVGYDETGRIQSPNVNEPPRVQDVASDLVRDALKKFPKK